MPTSYHGNISEIIDIIIKLDPQKILDIGPGFGKFGVLCREYLEFWDGRNNSKNWIRTIDAIEIFADYINPVHKFIYNNIYIGDAFDIIPTMQTKYDLILLIDVLEHLEKDKGEIFINKCLEKSNNVLISMPRDPSEQAEAFGNKFEHHVSKWSKQELKRLVCTYLFSSNKSFIVLISNKATIKLIKKYHFIEKFRPFNFLRSIPYSQKIESRVKNWLEANE
jgi:hypothetical protein